LKGRRWRRGQACAAHTHSSRVIQREEQKTWFSTTPAWSADCSHDDAFTDEQFPPTLFDAPPVVFPISRLIWDANWHPGALAHAARQPNKSPIALQKILSLLEWV
jgi:hypothetical protein